ncbi:hypothetical protein [Acidithiobacillus caldus]|uniref:Uncharacterized protein n=1 Tax=Acidithiobacillus caldus TaxID=33059 RepID=A0A1E7YNU4_9PROT|nr:hypothetical protein [Acidithiobacillus caldus]OFC36895.1 hypothetical protein BAE27_05040 [Acidithiobacillus caldus]OFC39412.1 hypothetical protein BAE28_03560 [Acidithiobacillus caldus]OFC41282.1 hypothetical protein BAE29_03270 [Acidithiobacillus caldus]
MTIPVLMPIGTRRGQAETWVQRLPERFPALDIRTIGKHAIDNIATGAKESDAAVFVIDTPYADIEEFQRDAERILTQGAEIFLEYFPAEPLIVLIQNDQRTGHILGAEELREDLRKLQELGQYEQALDQAEAKREQNRVAATV